MKRAIMAAAVVTMAMGWALGAAAQTGGECRGDFNLDGRVTIDELVAAVDSALKGCPSPERQGCLDSGGTVSTGLCCANAPEFPDTCSIGTCGCSPAASREVSLCDCAEGACFDRDARACIARAVP